MSEPMTNERFAEIERLAGAMTPGPLEVIEGDCHETNIDRWSVVAAREGRQFFVATIENGAPGDTLETEKANAAMFASTQEIVAELKRLREEAADEEIRFNIGWESDMRAIRMWQEANPGNERVWPSNDRLCVWLMQRLDEAAQVLNDLCSASEDTLRAHPETACCVVTKNRCEAARALVAKIEPAKTVAQ